MNDDEVERRRLLRSGIHHPLKLRPPVVRRRCARFDKLGGDGDALCLAIGLKLAALVRNRKIVFGLPAGRNTQIERGTPRRRQGGGRFGIHAGPPFTILVFRAQQLVEKRTEMDLENVQLSLGDGHMVRPVVGDFEARLVLEPFSSAGPRLGRRRPDRADVVV